MGAKCVDMFGFTMACLAGSLLRRVAPSCTPLSGRYRDAAARLLDFAMWAILSARLLAAVADVVHAFQSVVVAQGCRCRNQSQSRGFMEHANHMFHLQHARLRRVLPIYIYQWTTS